MEEIIRQLLEELTESCDFDMVISGRRESGTVESLREPVSKVKVRPVNKKQDTYFQIEEYRGKQVFHLNRNREEFLLQAEGYLNGSFRQAEIQTARESIHVLFSKKGRVTVKRKRQAAAPLIRDRSHDRKKSYLLTEGTPVPFLYELGVMSEDGHVVKAKYDKFRQINRFLEFVDDVYPELTAGRDQERELTIVDFGCGKSYLTFALYHYLRIQKGRKVKIIGLDLKKDVIAACAALAERLGYEGLTFLTGDIAGYDGVSQVDMVVTLHACDTATDYALEKAVRWGARVILSVPCCQHELNRMLQNEQLETVLKYGLVKERVAALLTDALRGNLLEARGYQVQLLEFIDMEHTPKNILIRAVRQAQPNPDICRKRKEQAEACMEFLHAEPTLSRLLRS